MTTEDRLHTREIEEQLAKEERGRRIAAKVRGNKGFLAGVREGLAAELRGEGVPLEEVRRRKNG